MEVQNKLMNHKKKKNQIIALMNKKTKKTVTNLLNSKVG